MGILSRIFGKPDETRALEHHSYGQFFGIQPIASGRHVNAHLAENLATVTACVSAVASVMGSMPAYVYRAVPGGRAELAEHPVVRLIRRPNARQTWPDWLEWTLAQALLWGNALSVVEYDGAGRPTALTPIPWRHVQVSVLPSGRIAYDVHHASSVHGGTGVTRRHLEGEVFHLRDRSDDGIIGRSRISRAPEVLGTAIASSRAAEQIFEKGLRTKGFFIFPGMLTPEQRDQARQNFSERYSGPNAPGVGILEGGVDFKAVNISPEDAELLESRRFSVEELCRLFQVPPPIVQDLSHGTFTNSREAGRWFAQFTLAPWARKIEAEFSRSVFGASNADCALELDMSGLMRADAEARWQSHKIAVDAGILDPDEIREIEGWNPRPAGKEPPAVTV